MLSCRTFSRIVFLSALVIGEGAPARAGESRPAAPPRVERTMALARLWAKVKVFHPWMQYKDVDWDSAFVRALPKVEAASTSDDFEAAVQSMLDELGDPVTRLVAGVSGPGSLRRPKSPWWPRTDVLLIDLSHLGWGPRDFAGSRQQVSALPELAASVVVFDLRGGGPTHENVQTFFGTLVDWGQLPAADRWPSERRVQYTGYPSHNPDFTMDGAEARMVEVASRPPSRTQRARPERVVFIVDGQSTLPYVAIALQQADRARIVAAGRMPQPPVTTMTVWLATGVRAEVRTGELLLPDGTGEVRPDIQVAANEDPLPKALDLAANSPWPKRAVRWAECLPKARRRYDAIYPDTKLPSRELRVLAVVRLWTAIEHFYGYPQLLDRWDEVLVEFIPRAEEAHAADAYVRVLLEMGALIEDSHVELWGSPVLDELFGEAGIPVSVRIVEGKPIVVQLPSDDAQIAGLEIGDEIVGVDGEPAAERMQHFERYVSASTPDARQQALARLLLRGKDGSLASVALRGADGRVRTVSMTRTRKPWPGSPSSPKYRLLPGNIGYVDLRTLTVGDVDANVRGGRWSQSPHFRHARLSTRKRLGHRSEAQRQGRDVLRPIPWPAGDV